MGGWVKINIGDNLVRRPRPCRPKGKVEVANVLRGCARVRVGHKTGGHQQHSLENLKAL